MSIFSKLKEWFGVVFSWIEYAIDEYQRAKAQFPEIIGLIEYLYDELKKRIDDEVMTPEAARETLIDDVADRFTNSPLSIPRSLIRKLLEVVHMKKKADSGSLRVYNNSVRRRNAERVLLGLRNKYGSR